MLKLRIDRGIITHSAVGFKGDFHEMSVISKNLQHIYNKRYKKKKHGEPKLPMPKPRFSRDASDYDLHERQVGCRS